MSTAERNYRWAYALVEGLVQSGVVHAVISPGSRSTPLTLACARHPEMRSSVVPDERSAAFFALGLSKAHGRPAAVIATSGSAPANWYPAVIEASEDRVPLVLLSADRPEELQHCGANQTIDQHHLFGRHVRAFFPLSEADDSPAGLRHAGKRAAQTVEESHWPVPGPVHTNVPFREPLVPMAAGAETLPRPMRLPRPSRPGLVPSEGDIRELAAWLDGGPGLLVCGRGDFPDGFPGALAKLAANLACPILADPLSGLRFGPHDRSRILTHYDGFLRGTAFAAEFRPDWVLRFGGVPTSKPLQELLDGLETDKSALVAPVGPWPDPGEATGRVLRADPDLACEALLLAGVSSAPSGWLTGFLRAEREATQWLESPADIPMEAAVMASLARNLPSEAILFCGNSLVVRDADSFLAGGGRHVRVVGNRGASGIDGNVSTVLGMASAGLGPVVGLLGDLAFYHDMNGLVAAREVDATLVVFNNGGGAIFDYLPQHALPEFERYWLTPTGLQLEKVAELYGLRYKCAEDAAGFDGELKSALDSSGVDVIEVALDRKESLERHKAYWAAVGRGQGAVSSG